MVVRQFDEAENISYHIGSSLTDRVDVFYAAEL